MKGKALRKQSLHGKTAAAVLNYNKNSSAFCGRIR